MPNPVRTEQEYIVRLLAAAQRFPWAGAALAAYASLSVLALPLPLLGLRFDGPPETRAALAVLAASFAAHLVAQAPAWIERAAALVLGNLVALAAMLEEILGGSAAKALPAVIAAAAGVAWSLFAPCRPPRARSLYAAELLAVAALAWGVSEPMHMRTAPTVAFLLALPVAFGAAVASRGSAAALVAWTAVLGAAFGAVQLTALFDRPPTTQWIAGKLGGAALVGATFGVLAAVARVARSFTVLPRDHPSLTDFEAGRPRESR